MINETLDNYYSQIRAEERSALDRRVEDAYALAPRLRELDEQRARLFFDLGGKRIGPAQAKKSLEEIAREERRVLASIGMPENALTLHYRCPNCGDTGYVSASRAPCACRLLLRERFRGTDGINARETFQTFSEDIFLSSEQKRRTMNAKLICEAYAAELPHAAKPSILLYGSPGLGKSFLGNAIGYDAISHGIDSLRITAYAFTQCVLEDIREHSEKVKALQNVPLLILDDLGSEPNIPNVSTEWFFAVINERLLASLASVFITNLSLKDLHARYGDRLASRLYDVNTTQVLHLTGENLRTVK